MIARAVRNVPLFAAAVFAVVAMVALGVALAWRAADQARLEEGRQENCVAIEEIKAALREDAAASFRSLDRSLRILGIAKTPEIMATARATRDERLARFAATKC